MSGEVLQGRRVEAGRKPLREDGRQCGEVGMLRMNDKRNKRDLTTGSQESD